MTYSTTVPFLVLLISITVFAGPRGGGPPGRRHGPPMGPPFLQNVTDEGRRAFFDIMRDWNLTLAEMETQTQQWAQTYGVQDAYNQFEANMTAHKEEVKQNVTRVVSQLSQAKSALEQVMDNKNQTRQQMKQAIDELKQQYPQEIPALFFISGEFRRGGRGHGMGPMGPMGPGPMGPGGRGGPGRRGPGRGGWGPDSGEGMGGMMGGGQMGRRGGPDSSDNNDF